MYCRVFRENYIPFVLNQELCPQKGTLLPVLRHLRLPVTCLTVSLDALGIFHPPLLVFQVNGNIRRRDMGRLWERV